MSEPHINFAQLRQFLLDLGFTATVVPNSHVAFVHSESGADMMLPIYKSNQIVLPRHLMPLRTLLDAKGLLEVEEFDRWLEANSLKQSAS